MATQYTSILKLALPVQGELSGTWGDVVNDNITSMVEEAIAGRKVINTWTGNSHTLTTADGTTSESRAAILTLTDTGTALTGAGTVVCPAASKVYIVENGTGQAITVKTASGTGAAVPDGKNMVVFCDGTNVEEGITNINSLTLNGDGATVSSIKDEDNMASDSATALATQQSIKAYVDSQVGTVDTLAEVLANGNTTGGTDVAFGDNDKAVFGAGSDLEIYHSSNQSIIKESGAGSLLIQGDNIRLQKVDGSENMITAVNDGAVTLYDNGSAKLATTATGIDVTGVITTDGMTTSADITFGDNDKAIFGAGSDLQIYHSGTTSFITENGIGDLRIGGNNLLLRSDDIFVQSEDGTANAARFNSTTGVTLYRAGAAKLATTSSGIDVTGTVTADGLTVDGDAAVAGTTGVTADNGTITTGKDSASSRTHWSMNNPNGEVAKWDSNGTDLLHYITDEYKVYTAGNKAFEIDGNGDISFYEDTGTTAKLFWDASAESLGIGTSSPQAYLHVYGNSAETLRLQGNDEFTYLSFRGTVGTEQTLGYVGFANDTGTAADLNLSNSQSGAISFSANGAERMRIDASGNLLVGQSTSTAPASDDTVGVAISPLGYISTHRTGVSAEFGRNNSDGDIAVFRRDGASVGSIGVDSGDNLYIGGSAASHGGLYFGTNTAAPLSAGTLTDDVMDLGTATYRFDDVYATNGTINTSDRNEKQDIEALSDAEQRVAVACKGLLRKFRWKSAVEEKGDEARIHFGIIAQDLQDAFTAEGLDAGRYAMFINSTWTDEETGEERSRMGVRYSELLAFIIAAI
jgi:hypothetical protein